MIVSHYKDGDMDGVDFNLRPHSNTDDVPEGSVAVFTFRDEGKVISVAGFYEMRDGVYAMWACQTNKVSCVYARKAKQVLNRFIDRYTPRLVYVGIETACDKRWAEFLGFTYEYTMHDFYADGKDLMGYVRHG